MATTPPAPTDPIPAASAKLATAINEFVTVVIERNAAAPVPVPPAPPAPVPAPPAPVPPAPPAPVPAPPAPSPAPAPPVPPNPRTPPAAPTAVTAAPYPGGVRIAWTNPAGVTQNKVSVSTTGDQPFNQLTLGPAASSFTHAVTAPGQYWYTVTAFNAAGESPQSAFAGPVTVGGTAPPAPTPAPPPGPPGPGPAPSPSPSPAPAPVTPPGALHALAYKLGQDEGIAYRFGEPSPASVAGVPTLPERKDAGIVEKTYYAFPPKGSRDNLYMTVGATVVGRPNDGKSVKDAVSWFQTASIGAYAEACPRPQLYWQADGTLVPAEVQDYIRSGFLSATDPADLPIGVFRGEGSGDAANTRVSICWTQGSDKVLPPKAYTTGTVTANNRATLTFPLGMVITGCGITTHGQFALFTAWDTKTGTGKVFVVSIGEGPNGWKWDSGQARYDYWHTWMDAMHPGLAGQGNYCFLKIIDTLDLPMKAPTSITASAAIAPATGAMYDQSKNGEISGYEFMLSPLSNAANRQRMLPGGDAYEMYAKGGVAIVASKSEKMVCFIDLGPLFTYTNDMYLGSASKNAETLKIGMGPNEWPYTLNNHPEARPVVVKTVTLDDEPTGTWITPGLSYWSKDDRQRAYEPDGAFSPTPHYPKAAVITKGGKLRVYSLGRYVAGMKPTTPQPSDIAEIGSISGLGSNITHMAICKEFPGIGDALNNALIYTDRASKKIGLVRLATGTGGTSVTCTSQTMIQDSRLVDPIAAAGVDHYQSTWHTVSVADYGAGCVRNYRFGPLVYGGNGASWSPAGLLDPKGEYCGALSLNCRPFGIYASNVP